MSTLNGLFEQPKPHKVNYIKENKKKLRRTISSASAKSKDTTVNEAKTRSAQPVRTRHQNENINPNFKPVKTTGTDCRIKQKGEIAVFLQDKNVSKECLLPKLKQNIPKICRSQFSQTIDPKKFDELYFDGKIRYPSPHVQEKLKEIKKHKQTTLDEYVKNNVLSARNKGETQISNIILPAKITSVTKPCKSANEGCNGELNEEKPLNAADILQETEDRFNSLSITKRSNTNSAQSNVSYDGVPSTYVRGMVPKYLRDRQEKKKLEEQRVKETYDPECPPGHVVLPDDERRKTLDMLKLSYSEAITELNQLPVRSDTLRVRQKKVELEKKLNKLEDGIKVFSKNKVYVKIT